MEKLKKEPRKAKIALRALGVKKYYGAVKAVDGVDLEVKFGECFGLLGPNGAGKTTLVEILEGLTREDSGEVEVLGYRWRSGNDRRFRERISVQLQETQFADKLTVLETVKLFRSFYPRGRSVEEVIQKTGLTEKKKERVHKLSGGTRQRLSLATALVSDPEILFLDEPTTGLDPQARNQVWEIIEEFRAQGGTIVLTTHYMEEASRLCDRVAIMDHGKILAQGEPRALIEEIIGKEVIEFQLSEKSSPEWLLTLPAVKGMEQRNEGIVLKSLDAAQTLPALISEAEKRNLKLSRLSTRTATLEDVFLSLTGEKLKDE